MKAIKPTGLEHWEAGIYLSVRPATLFELFLKCQDWLWMRSAACSDSIVTAAHTVAAAHTVTVAHMWQLSTCDSCPHVVTEPTHWQLLPHGDSCPQWQLLTEWQLPTHGDRCPHTVILFNEYWTSITPLLESQYCDNHKHVDKYVNPSRMTNPLRTVRPITAQNMIIVCMIFLLIELVLDNADINPLFQAWEKPLDTDTANWWY